MRGRLPGRLAFAFAIIAVVLVGGFFVAGAMSGRSAQPQRAQRDGPTRVPAGAVQEKPPAGVESEDLDAHLVRLRALPTTSGRSSEPPITGEMTQQPDLYAGEFVRRLLTQNYSHARADHLAWVQAESTSTADPLVVGLVPQDLRDRFAVYSVTDTSRGSAPVPSVREWAGLAAAKATTTVRIDRVIEPESWSNAVAAGRITDPGTTGRVVAATVTRHSTLAGHERSERFSVAVALNLEGPPTVSEWRFITVATYTVIPEGAVS